ncbi:MAG TPA: hypothetical protein VGE57_01625 [Solimonas sp.]
MYISYDFSFDDGTRHQVVVDVLRAERETPLTSRTPPPDWTRLDYKQCPNCPLKAEHSPRCPPAVDLVPTMDAFARIISHTEAQVTVKMAERTVTHRCQAQQALSSLVALMMATSGCPILGRMRGLARTHVPFATLEESLVRSLGAYLLGQLLVQRGGGEPDWDLQKLKDHYAQLEVLNKAFKARVRAASQQDASLNAVSALGILSMGIGFSIDDQLEALLPYTVLGGDP